MPPSFMIIRTGRILKEVQRISCKHSGLNVLFSKHVSFGVIPDLSTSRLCHAVCPGCGLSRLLHPPQPLPGQRHLHHLLRQTRQVLGERLQVGKIQFFDHCHTKRFRKMSILTVLLSQHQEGGPLQHPAGLSAGQESR